MKITGTSSYIKVEYEGKTLKIKGEMLINGFVAYKDTLTTWEPPNDNVLIDEVTKSKIIMQIIKETKNKKFKVEFE
jgi:hypothetical protein